MKKILLIVSVILALFLVGCNKQENKLTRLENMTNEEIVTEYLNQNEIWEDVDSLNTSFGYYIPGFSFFDIDLDGTKELAVQYSGGSMRNCVTRFYKFDGENVIEVYKTNPELNISIALNNLKKYTDKDARTFYLNMITYKIDANTYNTAIDEIAISDNMFDLINKFTYIEIFEDEYNSSITYFIGGEEVTKEEYDKEMNNYLRYLTKEEVTFEFISYDEWKTYTEEQKKEALIKALNA